MALATATLPTDPEELRAFALALQHELYSKTLHIEKLRAQLAALRRSRFGQSSENWTARSSNLNWRSATWRKARPKTRRGAQRRLRRRQAPSRLGRRAPAIVSRCPSTWPREIVSHLACVRLSSLRIRAAAQDRRRRARGVQRRGKRTPLAG